MTQGFQQQDPSVNFAIPKSAPSPQHGQKQEPVKLAPVRTRRSPDPRPGR